MAWKRALVLGLLLVVTGALGCDRIRGLLKGDETESEEDEKPRPEKRASGSVTAGATAPSVTAPLPSASAAPPRLADPLGPIPVGESDAALGAPNAPVTWVAFVDFQCPFCRKLHGVAKTLQGRYGPDKLRLVYKHMPLAPLHPLARSAAESAAAVLALDGRPAFFRFADAAFERLPRGTQGGGVADVLRDIGIGERDVQKLVEVRIPQKRVDGDVELAKKLGVKGTPHSFINGVSVPGAVAEDKLTATIDEQLRAAELAKSAGVADADLYAFLTAKNLEPAAAGPGPDDRVFRVPIDGSPVLGPADALVTAVVFSDFECKFCGQLAQTFGELRVRYPSDLRVVFKHAPIASHRRGEAAAELALEARARGGDVTFWNAHDLLFVDHTRLEDGDLEGIARKVGLDPAASLRAVHAHAHAATLALDRSLADRLEVTGVPVTFLNGRRNRGAKSADDLAKIVDVELAKARALVDRGVGRGQVYDEIMKTAAPGKPTL
jgi:protein-disulfide isomerase